MAMYSAGTTVTWRGTTIGKVTELRFLRGGSLPIGRSSVFSVDVGTIEISSVAATSSVTSMSLARVDQYGLKGTIDIQSYGGTAGQGTLRLTTKAICQSLDITAKLNDVWRFKGVWKLVQE